MTHFEPTDCDGCADLQEQLDAKDETIRYLRDFLRRFIADADFQLRTSGGN